MEPRVKPDLHLDPNRLHPERPPVLLLGGLNVLRALGAAGIPAVVATRDPAEPALASRFCAGRLMLPPGGDPEALLEALLAAGSALLARFHRRVPLFYGNDDGLELVSDHREALSEYFLLLLNGREESRGLLEKDRFEGFASSRGVAVPRTLSWESSDANALAAATGPVIAKPKVKVGWDNAPELRQLFGPQGKAKVFDNGAEALRHPLAAKLHGLLTFQEYVPGTDRELWSFHGYADEAGRILACFVGRKIRTCPELTGMSTYLELAHDSAFEAFAREATAKLGLRGPFKIDCKRGTHDGQFRVLEVNARFNLWHYLGAKNGVNLAAAAYEYLVHGRRPEAQLDWRTTHRWVCLRLDREAYRELHAAGRLTPTGWVASLLAAPKVYDLFAWDDPMPFLRAQGERLARAPAKVLEKLAPRGKRWPATAS